MAQYVSYDPSGPSPQPIIGWYDTDLIPYPNLPPVASEIPAGFVAVTAAQWTQHLGDLAKSTWAVVDGAVTYTAPVAPTPTAAQVAAAAYAAFVGGGLTVTSTATPALNGVYPIDADSQVTISTEAQFISTFSEFTNGATTGLQWMLQTGAWVTFPTTAEFMAFAKASAQVVAAAKLAAAQGAAMPAATATIP